MNSEQISPLRLKLQRLFSASNLFLLLALGIWADSFRFHYYSFGVSARIFLGAIAFYVARVLRQPPGQRW